MRFVDTNILLYAISGVVDESDKARRALEVLAADDLAVSIQVLQEFYVQATRPTRRDRLSDKLAVDFIATWLRFRVQEITLEVFQAALRIKTRHDLSYWDAAIIAAAQAAGCDAIWSEDLSHGHDYDGVRVINPFV